MFVLWLLIATVTVLTPARADLTLAGPTGFVNVPSHQTVHVKGVEFAAHARSVVLRNQKHEKTVSHLALAFSPVRDFELGCEMTLDPNNGVDEPEFDPTINFKVRFSSLPGDAAHMALGFLFDTNPNNYHTAYLTWSGFGVGCNFGGNPGFGTARYGSYDRERKEPKTLFLLLGGEFEPRRPGERGYKHRYMLDYNGDVYSLGWRLSSHRGFWVDAAVSSKTSWDPYFDWRPLTVGVGGLF